MSTATLCRATHLILEAIRNNEWVSMPRNHALLGGVLAVLGLLSVAIEEYDQTFSPILAEHHEASKDWQLSLRRVGESVLQNSAIRE